MDTPPLSAPPDAFGRAARDYERGRPGWPEPLLDEVAAELGLGADSSVLDLAAGTGKLTRLLVPRFRRVVAVELDEAMLAVLAEVVPQAEPLLGPASTSRSTTRRSTASSSPRPSTGSPPTRSWPRSSASCGRAAGSSCSSTRA